MKHWFKFKHLFFFGLVIVLINVACNLPVGGNENQEPSSDYVQATIVVGLTEMAQAAGNDYGIGRSRFANNRSSSSHGDT